MSNQQRNCTVRDSNVTTVPHIFLGDLESGANALITDYMNSAKESKSYTIGTFGPSSTVLGISLTLNIPVIYITRQGNIIAVIDSNGVQCDNVTHEEFLIITAIYNACMGVLNAKYGL